MNKTFCYRIYGDNIIECLRIIKMVENNSLISFDKKVQFVNQLLIRVILTSDEYTLILDLVPGFDKANKHRWKENILDEYKKLGSTLDETADAFISEVNGNTEKILAVIEFCSALQAGNQAWQRSGRAFSCGQTRIPYFYVIDLPKYELDPETRERKSLRLPNPVVAFSYLAYSTMIDSPVLQIITKAEEFFETQNMFDEKAVSKIFNDTELEDFLVKTLIKQPADEIVERIKAKNFELVKFLPTVMNIDFTAEDISKIDAEYPAESIIKHTNIKFKKRIAQKSATGKIIALNEIVSKYSIGVFKKDLPFGIIPGKNIKKFVQECAKIYRISDTYKKELLQKGYIVVTLMKGFKPGGDDNRPDRGILPMLRMLFGEAATILTIIYGPIVKSNYDLLLTNKVKLGKSNGLWQTYINLSDYLLYDCPVIGEKGNVAALTKMNHVAYSNDSVNTTFRKLDLSPVGFREDEVDSLFHLLFEYYVPGSFCGMCNPPGGDWSGISIRNKEAVYRWLSLPRVSEDKRPDHVIQVWIDETDYIMVM